MMGCVRYAVAVVLAGRHNGGRRGDLYIVVGRGEFFGGCAFWWGSKLHWLAIGASCSHVKSPKLGLACCDSWHPSTAMQNPDTSCLPCCMQGFDMAIILGIAYSVLVQLLP